ncbi:hypothetical protein PLICRDRAFT_172448 [Plicaturopsis crispa FD-325 SS-3]|nr:hypothetical protein PLICRDRAFT_172448 [Plicaturopsis crispa FD-325 SS-3]
MADSLASLPALERYGNDTLDVEPLPQVLPHFFVPRLVDKPQNPIMDGLRVATYRHAPMDSRVLPQELVALTEGLREMSEPLDTLWTDAIRFSETNAQNQVKSWDALRSSYRPTASCTPFLSEQSHQVFAAAQYHVQPPLHDHNADVIYVSQHNLLRALKMTIVGTSSPFHTWDMKSELFIQVGRSEGKTGIILIDGKDKVISDSVTRRFMTIGTLLRRLEIFVVSVRSRSANGGPTVYAFAHALSSILDLLRHQLASSPPTEESGPSQSKTLSTIWMQFGKFEDILIALAKLCQRDIRTSPADYPPFNPIPVDLLSRIYDALNSHLERGSPRHITSLLAYILTRSSADYFQSVCLSVGFGGDSSRHTSQLRERRLENQKSGLTADEGTDDDDDEDDIFDDTDEETYPTFFPSDLVASLPAAKRSLKLLRAACPDHPLLGDRSSRPVSEWFWGDEEVQAAWDNGKATDDGVADRESNRDVADSPSPVDNSNYPAELGQFRIYDLEPGAHLVQPAFATEDAGVGGASLHSFLSSFPPSLPPLTPTLAHLTSLVLSPLSEHVSHLSSTLLSLFLSPSSTFNVHSHLVLLRSYLLLTSHSFKSRLAAALFSDSADNDSSEQSARMLTRARRKPAELAKVDAADRPWAVGLAPALTERATWPPGGADLSFYLRTVIVDSLEPRYHDGEHEGEKSAHEHVLEEAEFRLGFAIRDLPVGPGRDRWLNPLSIEALDFLYMDYKPPHPLGILISPEILSKYQRMFAFILRMMRVENVIRSLFRMTRKRTDPLFPTLSSSNKLLLHFRSLSHLFVNTLSSYVFDIVIGGHFDNFLQRLSAEQNPSLHREGSAGYSDVFALADAHSNVLDEILSACLLRSGQRAVGDVLRGALEIVLEFGILAGEIETGRLEEYQAAPLLDDLFQAFRAKMKTLTKVLKGLVDKGSAASRLEMEYAARLQEGDDSRRSLGGTEMLYHLLIRLDMYDWWSTA